MQINFLVDIEEHTPLFMNGVLIKESRVLGFCFDVCVTAFPSSVCMLLYASLANFREAELAFMHFISKVFDMCLYPTLLIKEFVSILMGQDQSNLAQRLETMPKVLDRSTDKQI